MSSFLVAPWVGFIVVVGLTIAGWVGLTQPDQQVAVSPTPSASQTAEPSAVAGTLLSSDDLDDPTEIPDATQTPSPVAVVKDATATPTPTTATEVPPSGELGIEFVDLPRQVQAGEKFTVTWRVTGPQGLVGEKTRLKASYHVSSSSNGSSSSVSSDTSQSFGSFTVPETFSTDFSLGSAPGTVELEISAEVGGKTITAHSSVQLM